MKNFIASIMPLIFIGCSDGPTTYDRPQSNGPKYVELSEPFEGRWYFQNGGVVELYVDHENKIGVMASAVVFTNSVNSLSTYTIVAGNLYTALTALTGALTALTGANAALFTGNQLGAYNNVVLPSGSTYRHYLQ